MSRVMRPVDWSFPPRPVHREVLERHPVAPRPGLPPLLFVHGARHAAWCWEPWLDLAAERGFSAYAVSLRGHGGSGGGERVRRTWLRDYVHDVVQTAVRLPRQPVLIGHSLGGLVVERALGVYAAKAAALLAPAPLQNGVAAAWLRLRDRPGDVLTALLGEPLPMRHETLFVGLDRSASAAHLARLGGESTLALYQLTLPHRPVPTRVPVLVAGTPDDALVPVADVERTAEFYGVTPRWYPGLGHDLMLDEGNEKVLDDVLNWVADEVTS
jgi:alpha-beta hydrolase superfamily lysophospholipase